MYTDGRQQPKLACFLTSVFAACAIMVFAPGSTLSSAHTFGQVPDDQHRNEARLNVGNPWVFEAYWKNHDVVTYIPASLHISYAWETRLLAHQFSPLIDNIRRLHKLVGSVNTGNCHIVLGLGETQLIYAVLETMSIMNHTMALAPAPYYPGYRRAVNAVQRSNLHFSPDVPIEPSGDRLIEFITSPNNPDGQARRARLKGDRVVSVYDLAYYWPQFSPVNKQYTCDADGSLLLFTMSKMSGHASTRIGWAMTSSKTVANRLIEYTTRTLLPQENQLRASTILSAILETKGSIFRFGQNKLKERWQALRDVFKMSTKMQLVSHDSASIDLFSGKMQRSSPAYAWIVHLDGYDAAAYLRANGLRCGPGTFFGASSKFTRCSMIDRDALFQQMIKIFAATFKN